MTIYRFSIEVSGIDPNEMGLEDRFYGDGVDDALISVSNGRLVFAFDREATDAESGIHSAREDILKRGG
ncbi:MAG: hypothetical protein WA417_19990, partial [Stellaceae bacterium]